jgi:hypothetical protein
MYAYFKPFVYETENARDHRPTTFFSSKRFTSWVNAVEGSGWGRSRVGGLHPTLCGAWATRPLRFPLPYAKDSFMFSEALPSRYASTSRTCALSVRAKSLTIAVLAVAPSDS